MSTITIPKKILARQKEITDEFLLTLDNHLRDITSGKVARMFEIKDVAAVLHIHPTHLSNTIKLTTGKAPCYFFEEKILIIAKEMLQRKDLSIASIALSLTYDPSNFTKFFKRFTNQTPKEYREEFFASLEKNEILTT